MWQRFVVATEALRQPSRNRQFLIIGLSVLALFLGPRYAAAQSFVDISTKVTITKSGLLLNRATNTFNSVVTVTNSSPAVINAPLVLNVVNITPGTITLANSAGQGPSGAPYVNFTVPPNGLSPGASISNVLLAFNDPSRINFTFALSVANIAVQPGPLPSGVVGPLINSVPPSAAVVGKPMQYQVVASSANPASLTFSLSAAPTGMTINSTTGLVAWIPGANQAGDQSVTIVAQDSAGQTTQSFTLSVFGTQVEVTATIPAASGGVITVNDPTSAINGLSLSIPAGALATNTTLTISKLISPPTLGGTTHFWMQGFSIDPDGTSLTIPATVTIPYNPTQFGAQDGIPLESFLGVYFVQTSTGNLQFLSTSSVNSANHVLTMTIPHFSAWEITNVARLCPPTGEPNCPNSYSPTSQSLLLPVVMVHGFAIAPIASIRSGSLYGMGDESTWGNLRTLLGQIDSGNSGRIDAWRFDWDSLSVPFEQSAQNLRTALTHVESAQTGALPHLVNLVAHSFGGILVRTYLQGFAAGAPYENDVNRVMTLGTPHTGIGGSLSLWLANLCALSASLFPSRFPTCFEAGTQQPLGPLGTEGQGEFLLTLNERILPSLEGSLSPSYLHIKGQKLWYPPSSGGPLELVPDDGLITLSGAQLCGGSPTNVCSGVDVQEETIATSTASIGLCHSGTLLGITCAGSAYDIAMVEVNDTSHPLWQKICQFLGCGPAINVTVLNPAGGTVTSDMGGINCGSTCSAVYAGGTSTNPITVTLTANPSSGFTFSGWSGSGAGSCTTQLSCKITIGTDLQTSAGPLFTGYPVTANFSPALGAAVSLSLSCTPYPSPQGAIGTVTVDGAAVLPPGYILYLYYNYYGAGYFWSGLGTYTTCAPPPAQYPSLEHDLCANPYNVPLGITFKTAANFFSGTTLYIFGVVSAIDYYGGPTDQAGVARTIATMVVCR
jgi:hypothetical protein